MFDKSNQRNEFSRPFSRQDLLQSEKRLELAASPEECRLLAERLGVVAITKLVATLQIVPWRRNGFAVSGDFRASIVQTCVVSLDEFSSEIQQTVSARFTDADDPVLERFAADREEIVIDPFDDDDPEVLHNGSADLGEFIVECLATELDPHPRKPGSDFQAVMADVPASLRPDEDEKPNPFAMLSQLKRPQGK